MTPNFDDFDDIPAATVHGAAMPQQEAGYSRLQYLVDNTPAIIYASVPTGDFRMTYVSNNAQHVLGYAPAQMTADPNFWFNHIHPDDTAQIFSSLALLFTEGRRSYEYRFMNSAGNYVWMHDMLRLIRDAQGNPVEVVGSLTDITERKRMEEDLRRTGKEQQILIQKLGQAQQQLLQAEKMASVGQLAAGIAHEINNPVGFVNSNMHSLQSYVSTLFQVIGQYDSCIGELALSEASRKAIAGISRNADLAFIRDDVVDLVKESLDGLNRIKVIVESLTDFSQAGPADWQPDDLHRGIENTLQILGNKIRDKADVIREFGDLPPVQCVISQLNQVWMNLFINAVNAMPDRGVITVSTGMEDRAGAAWAWIRIADTGTGIAPENLSRIFDPFFTTQPVGSGTGLGLSLAYSIISQHNGAIKVDSVPGKGTRFTIFLPVVQGKNPGMAADTAQPQEISAD